MEDSRKEVNDGRRECDAKHGSDPRGKTRFDSEGGAPVIGCFRTERPGGCAYFSKRGSQSVRRETLFENYQAGSLVNVGSFANHTLVGVAVIGVGPFNIHRLFLNANPEEVSCLSRLWLDDRCGRNSDSRVLGIICSSLRRWQSSIKAIVAYSDPTAGDDGTIYRAAGFAYLGTSEAMPLYRLPDGRVHHSRSLGHSFGTHSLAHFKAQGIEMRPVPQTPKFIYAALIDPAWGERLTRPVLPYSQGEAGNASS